MSMRRSEEWEREYYQKMRGLNPDKPDPLTAELARQTRRAAVEDLADDNSERWIQNEVVRQLRLLMPQYGANPDLICGCDGGSKRESERQRQVDLGYKPGWPDIVIAEGRGGYNHLYIEVKRPGGALTPQQKFVHQALRDANNMVITGFGVQECVQGAIDYLKLSKD